MKNVLLIIILYIILGSVLTGKLSKQKKVYLKKNLKKVKDNLKIYQENKKEYLVKNNNGVSIKIKKFYNFERENNEKKIKFGVFFYFYGRKVAENINLKLLIFYDNEGRIQKKTTIDETSQCLCTIKSEYKDKIDINDIRENIGYNCIATTSLNLNITKATLNKNYSLLVDDEEINFEDINFNQESMDIVLAPSYKKAGILDEAQIKLKQSDKYFQINGILKPDDLLSKGDIIHFQLGENEENKKIISCKAIKIEVQNCILECSFQNQLENISTINIDSAENIDSNIYIIINLKQEESKVKTTTLSLIRNRRHGGWSTKTIIFLVVIGVVLILGASILAIILKNRKNPSPSVDDKTKTVVQLKADEVIIQKNNQNIKV